MQKIRNFIKHYWHLLLLLAISLVSHWYIFFDNKILNAGDWLYVPQELLKKLIFYGQWNAHSNLGEVIISSPNMVFYWFASILANISPFFSWDIFTRLFILIPIVFLTPLFSFLLFRKIFKNDLIALFCGCIYSFNTFFLKLQLDWITYAFMWWVLPALFLSILNYLETKKNKYLIYNALLVFLGIVYEIRIMILVLIFLSLFQTIYLIFNNGSLKTRIKNILYIILSFFLGILGHTFWLIPLKFGNTFGEVMGSASSSPFFSFYDLLAGFTLHMYSWSHNLVLEPFIKQPIELRHFLIPLVAIIGIIIFRKLFKEKKDVLYFIFFAISLVLFIFLGKQAFEPFKNFYGWAFSNVPLFNLYRESSKFYILIALSLAFFFGLGLFYIYQLIKNYNKRIAFFIVILILFFSSIFNLQHFIDQKIGGMVKGEIINDDYLKLEKKLSTDPNYYRILWMPANPRFGFYSEKHPFLNAISLSEVFKKEASFTLFDNSMPVYSQLLFLLQQNYSDQLIDNMAVKYVILPIAEARSKKISITETQDVIAIYEHSGKKESFIKELDKLPYLKNIDIGTNELIVYENENFRPHIYMTKEQETLYQKLPYEKIVFEQKNPAEYIVHLKNVSESFYLNFSESYHPDWGIKIGNFNWFSAILEKNYFLKGENHMKNNAGLNSFYIDLSSISNNNNYTKNKDGSYNFDLTLYFKPQSYFYLGLMISGFILAAVVGYLVYDLRKRKLKNKKNI